MVRKGDIIIALTTSGTWGYRTGDTLVITDVGDSFVRAKNLTRPELTSMGRTALLLDAEYVEYKAVSRKEYVFTRKKVYFLGIPILTIKEAE